jgi:predicted secreted protein
MDNLINAINTNKGNVTKIYYVYVQENNSCEVYVKTAKNLDDIFAFFAPDKILSIYDTMYKKIFDRLDK